MWNRSMWNRLWIGLGAVAGVALVGVLLGTWLSWHAPVEPVSEDTPISHGARAGDAPVAATDAEALVPEPPQPRLDGTRGVPSHPSVPVPAAPMVSVMENPTAGVQLSTQPVDEDAIREQYESGALIPRDTSSVVTSGGAPVAAVDAPGFAQGANGRSAPAAVATAPLPGVRATDGAVPAWLGALREDLNRCASQSPIGRIACTEQAKWRHCGPRNAWGQVPECPQTGNN